MMRVARERKRERRGGGRACAGLSFLSSVLFPSGKRRKLRLGEGGMEEEEEEKKLYEARSVVNRRCAFLLLPLHAMALGNRADLTRIGFSEQAG